MIVFDIDGVLSDARHREHHLAGRPRDWAAFFAAADQDTVIEAGRVAVLEAMSGAEVVLVSGRPERLRSVTVDWLARHGFPPLALHLRSDSDRRPAPVVKAAILDQLGGPAIVTEVHDDDAAVVEALRQAGYAVVHVTRPGEVS
ncbi:MAG: hypothetical protein KGP12_00735 [Actinomycetales bacterium]|nr:hypothetical protein [Actinomycetales bacterium]